MKLKNTLLLAAVLGVLAVPALAHWMPGDGHKMHFPQLPDMNGWDVFVEEPVVLADDWQCSETGLVDDIHFWGSWRFDNVGIIDNIKVQIYDDDRSGAYSKPGNLLWDAMFLAGDYSVQHWGTGEQGWYNPASQEVLENNHLDAYQINIDNIDQRVGAFLQEEGTIYWLALSVNVTDCQFGWKTADTSTYPDPYTGNHFEDDAVWLDAAAGWQEMTDPITTESLDLAFVITPEPTSLMLLTVAGLLGMRRRR